MTTADWLAGGERKELALRAIQQAATEQLLEGGLRKFTAEAVARRAGCSRATLYRVAGGKKALLDTVLAQGAERIGRSVAAGIQGLPRSERVCAAILIGLRELRAEPALNDWVRSALASDDILQSSEFLASVARQLIHPEPVTALEGQWILRVYLQLVAWPAPDEETEAALVRQFVGPAFA